MSSSANLNIEASSKVRKSGIFPFFILLLILAAIDISLAFIAVPLRLAFIGSLAVSVITVGLPIYALYRASRANWTPRLGAFFLVGGILVQIAFTVIAIRLQHTPNRGGMYALILVTLSQMALLTWCLGVGGLLASVIKDRNMILPIAIVLAALDTFLVLSPFGFTHKLLKTHPEVIRRIGYHVNLVPTRITHAPLSPMIFIGPADFLFLGMFFITLSKFGMKTEKTFRTVAPVLLIYLLIVAVFGGMRIGPIPLGALPALLPIGLVIVIVNYKEWQMTVEEKIITFVIFLLACGLVVFGFSRVAAKQATRSKDSGQSQVSQSPIPPGQVPNQHLQKGSLNL